MSAVETGSSTAWSDAAQAAALFAVDPSGTGGIALRSRVGPVRDRWLACLREILPGETSVRRVPLHATDERLLGGLDLAATLRLGRPVAARGLLAEADGGVVCLAMAERLEAPLAARLGHVLDSGAVVLERDGLAARLPARVGVVALDEGAEPEERPPAALLERLAFQVDLEEVCAHAAPVFAVTSDAIARARAQLARVRAGDAETRALCAVAWTLGIGSLRAPLFAIRAARAAAALAGRDEVMEADVGWAVRLVLAPRALAIPDAPPPERTDPGETAPESDGGRRNREPGPTSHPGAEPPSQEERILAAAKAAVPDDLLSRIGSAGDRRHGAGNAGRGGAPRCAARRGRRIGVRRNDPGSGARLDVVETLRSAAPWQRLRRSDRPGAAASVRGERRLEVRRDDFRFARFQQRAETTALFVVDASGSTALQRLAEAKGAVELLLAECYVRRERVGLIGFRGAGAEILLPPTRSLVRAKRSLARLPGGGGTPLAAGIEAAFVLAQDVRRGGATPLVIFLTDGRANVARDGTTGREPAERDAWSAARRVRAAGFGALVLDTSPRPQATARRLAQEMGAPYQPLPHADSAALRDAVRGASAPTDGGRG